MNRKFERCWIGLAFVAALFLGQEVRAQGGETCATATVISALPYCDTGTTVGHVNDYTPPCVTGVAAPDVVYSYTPVTTQVITVSLCFSAYNTALHVWRGCPDAGGALFCCNDNLCALQSCCQNLTVAPGFTYYFIVDGSLNGGGASAGQYLIQVVNGPQCPTQPCDPDICPFPDRDFEPANNTCTGNVPVLSCDDTLCGEINPTNDQDWYSIDLPQPDCVILTIDVYADDTPGWWPFGMGLNPKVWLVGIDCATVLAMDDDGGVGTDSRLVSPCLVPGRYKIMVQNASATQPGGPYVLRTSCETCQCPADSCNYRNGDIEPNNTCASAGVMPFCPDTVCGLIDNANDGDYYQFQIPSGTCAVVTIDVFGDDTPGWWPFGQGLNPQFCLYDGGCTMTISCRTVGGVGDDPRLVTPCLPGGLYKLRVASEGGTIGPYILALDCEPCPCPVDTCPYPDLDFEPVNDSCSTNIPIFQCGDTLCGEIDALGDEDWYCVQLPGPECNRIVIDVFGNDTPGWWPFGQGLNPLVRLIGPDCTTLLGFDDNGGEGTDSRLVSDCLPPGLYRILIEGTGTIVPTIGPYILATYCEPCPCPCDLTCPANAIPEGEPCPNIPDNFNSGCLSTPPSFSPIQCNSVVCGTSFAAAGASRDTDWYLLQLTARDSVYWWVTAEFQFEMAVFDLSGGCANLDTLIVATGDTCDTVCVVDCFEPGVYALYVAPLPGTIWPCSEYIMWLQCRPCAMDTCPYPSRDFEAVNNTCETFNPQLTCDDTLCGDIQPVGDRDWYLLFVPDPCAIVTIDVFGDDTPGWWPFGQGLDPRVTLVSLDCGTVITFDLNSGIGEDPRLVSPCLPGGLYHVLVEGEGAAAPSTGPYIIAVHCDPCDCTPCDIDCVVGDTPEGEPCPNYPDAFNSGCDSPIGGVPLRPIQCGQTICGHLQADTNRYDRDWYQLRTNENDTLMWCVWSEVPIRTYIIAAGPGGNPCIFSDTLVCRRTSGPCDTVCMGVCVPPGEYLFKIESNVDSAPPYPVIPCSTTYRARLLCTICSPALPETPDSVVIHYPTIAVDDMNLHWPPVPGAESYFIYRSTNSEVIPSPATYIGMTADTFYVDPAIVGGVDERNFYVIKASIRVNGCR